MLIDGREAGPDPERYDVLIVGSGPAGMSLALELEGLGLRIALLESGGEVFDPVTQALADGPITGNTGGVDLAAIRLRVLGGTSNHWGGYCAPLDPIDFERAPPGLSGWPITHARMQDFYARAHPYLDLGVYDYALDAATDLDEDDLLLQGDASFRTKLLRQSAPTNFGLKYDDRLAASDDIDLWLWTNVTEIALAADGVVERLVAQSIGGPPRRFRASIVVMACGAVENARQLMLANARSGTSFGDAGGLLGRCYMDHPTAGSGFLTFDRPMPPKAYWTDFDRHATDGVPFQFLLAPTPALLEAEDLPNVHFFVIPIESDPEARALARESSIALRSLKTMAKFAIGREAGPQGHQLDRHYCNFISNADSFVEHSVTELVRGSGVDEVLLKFELEQLPDRDNRIFLDERRDALGLPVAGLNWAPSTDAVEHVKRTTTLLGASAGAAGLGRMRLEEHDDVPYWAMVSSWHQMGTTRMAESPTAGVCDIHGRVHGTQALFMAGSGLFPRAGCSNPTLTIVALSMRMADHIKAEIATL